MDVETTKELRFYPNFAWITSKQLLSDAAEIEVNTATIEFNLNLLEKLVHAFLAAGAASDTAKQESLKAVATHKASRVQRKMTQNRSAIQELIPRLELNIEARTVSQLELGSSVSALEKLKKTDASYHGYQARLAAARKKLGVHDNEEVAAQGEDGKSTKSVHGRSSKLYRILSHLHLLRHKKHGEGSSSQATAAASTSSSSN